MLHVIFTRREQVAEHIYTFWFRPEKAVRYLAGQFTELHLPHADADGRGERRWFTLSSSPTETELAITTRIAPNEHSSFKRELAALRPGTALGIADPMGDFVLPKDASIPLVFAAAGLGITPVHSMVQYLQHTGEQRQIHLIYAVSRLEEAAWLPLFQDYPLQLTLLVKHPPASYRGDTGSLDSARLLKLAGRSPASYLYLSGPEPMVETFYKDLTASGIAGERLVTDYFPGYMLF